MKLCHTELESVLDTDNDGVQTLVIENKLFFTSFLTTALAQAEGEEGAITVSSNNKPLDFASHAEVIIDPLSISLNKKALMTKITATLESEASQSEHYAETMEILTHIETFIDKLSFIFPFDIICNKLSAATLLKAAGIAVRDICADPLERLLNYMELVREFDKDKLFIIANLRTFFSDTDIERFLESIALHGYHAILLESTSGSILEKEHRITVDKDLCEF